MFFLEKALATRLVCIIPLCVILPQISCLGGYKSRDHANRIEADPGTMDAPDEKATESQSV